MQRSDTNLGIRGPLIAGRRVSTSFQPKEEHSAVHQPRSTRRLLISRVHPCSKSGTNVFHTLFFSDRDNEIHHTQRRSWNGVDGESMYLPSRPWRRTSQVNQAHAPATKCRNGPFAPPRARSRPFPPRQVPLVPVCYDSMRLLLTKFAT